MIGALQKGYVIAIDGGGTHTRYLLCDLAGNDLARVDSAASNYRKSNIDVVKRELKNSAHRLRQAHPHLRFDDVRAVCAGFAGVDTKHDVELLTSALADSLDVPSHVVHVCNDGQIALEAALQGRPGVLVISGTGSIVWAASSTGQHVRIGGWDYLLGDEGSGYDIGLRALRMVAAVHDGRMEAKKLSKAVFHALHVSDFEQLVESAYAERLHPQQIASLSSAVESAAADGDDVARIILADAARELVMLVKAAVDQADLHDDVKIVPMGGVLKAKGYFTFEFERILQVELPDAKCVHVDVAPVIGAKRMAFRILERSLKQEKVGRS